MFSLLFYIETLYIRRRSLLLQEKSAKIGNKNDGFRKSYLQLRSSLLHVRYGIQKEMISSRSRSVSLRGASISSNDNKNLLGNSQEDRYMSIFHMLDHVKCH